MEKVKKGKKNTGNTRSAKRTGKANVVDLPPSYAFLPILKVLIKLIERGYFESFRG